MNDLRYRSFSSELRRIFGCRVQRVSLDVGFSCPNRDGTVGSGGCIYCGDHGAGAIDIIREASLAEQLQAGKEYIGKRYEASRFLAYFQAFSNTYAPALELKHLYEQVLSDPDVVGMIIGTRPDCLQPEVVSLLADCHRRTLLWVELGLQSSHDRTLQLINRGHDLASFISGVSALKSYGIRVCAHVILGLPGESREDMLATADLLNRLAIDGVKVHHLYVLPGTQLAEMYQRNEIELLDRDSYIGLAADFLERLHPLAVIHRLVGDGGPAVIAPRWGIDKSHLLAAITTELARRGTRQGSRCIFHEPEQTAQTESKEK